MLLSIIIPVHNAEKYLESCVKSVYEQELSLCDFEVILVNNASSDNSLNICRRLKDSHFNIVLIDTDTPGVSNARNLGLQQAQGEYIHFIDSDDELLESMYVAYKKVAISDKPDLVVSGIDNYYETENKHVIQNPKKNCILSDKEAVSHFIRSMTADEKIWLMNVVWNKWYKRSFIFRAKTKFDTALKVGEDFVFNCSIFAELNSCSVLSQAFYLYFHRSTISALNQFHMDELVRRKRMKEEQKKLYHKLDIYDMNHEIEVLNGELLFKHLYSIFRKDCTVDSKEYIKSIMDNELMLDVYEFFDSKPNAYYNVLGFLARHKLYNSFYFVLKMKHVLCNRKGVNRLIKLEENKDDLKGKNIAIVTLYDSNLGNRLQNFALQKVIESLSGNVTTFSYKFPLIKRAKINVKALLGVCGVKKYEYFYWKKLRDRRCKSFNAKYIKHIGPINIDQWKKLPRLYDYYVIGSDQVWHNWNLAKRELEYFYLQFVPQEKRIAYAPSFGFSTFQESDKEKHRIGLEGINKLSCREQEGCDLIKKLTDKEATRVIDPTFLLSVEEWRKIERKPLWLNDKKIVTCYFLGTITAEYRQRIARFENVPEYQVLFLNSLYSYEEYAVTPDEFLYLIDNSEAVFTDSFHACVFSLLFRKKFLAFPRKQEGMEDMKGRIETLFNILKIRSRWYHDSDIEDDLNVEYENIIDYERKRAILYLKECFKQK